MAFSSMGKIRPYNSKKDRLINGTYLLPVLSVRLVLLLAVAKMPCEEAVLCSGHITKVEQSIF